MPHDFLYRTELVEGDTPPVGKSGRRLHGVAAHHHAHLHLKIENKISPGPGDSDYQIIVFRIRKFLGLPDPDPSIYKQKKIRINHDFNCFATS
jgi:hypothetical protein